jgi:dipeptidyl aminopeptidase/acylaminoacyl peptidase
MPARLRSAAVPARFPGLGRAREIEPGIPCYEVSLPRETGASRLWIYLPRRPGRKKLPCILIAAAGSRLFDGMALGDGDRPEHLPYARAGFAVVAYEIDGALPDHPSSREILAAARAFEEADAGRVNAREALEYALAKLPGVDPRRLYTAGHSSAATLSLLVAEHEPRIKACIAYAPVCDVPARLGNRLIEALSPALPGYREFIERSSPRTSVARLRCPVFLFHADDDMNVPTHQVADFAAALQRTNPRVTFVQVPHGDHYHSMIQQGIPHAIRWLRHLS